MEGSSALCAPSDFSPVMCDAPTHESATVVSRDSSALGGGPSTATCIEAAGDGVAPPGAATGHPAADSQAVVDAMHEPPSGRPAVPEREAGAERPAIRLMVDGTGSPRGVRPEQVIEALLFASDRPLSAAKLADLVGSLSVNEVRLHVAALNDKYTMGGMAFRIEAIAGGFQMMTLPDYQGWLNKLARQRAETRLSGAALETLSIVAYKQPVIRADVEAIRGVASGEVLNRLREMGLVKIIGRAEVVGRPMLYGTTRKFLDVFGMASLEDLPPMETLSLRRPVPPATGQDSIRAPRAAAGA